MAPTVTAGLASCNRRNDGDFIRFFHGRASLFKKTDVFVINEHIHEAAHLAGVVANALLQAGKRLIQRVQNFRNSGA